MSTTFSYHICQLCVQDDNRDAVESIFGYLYGIDDETGKNSTERFNVPLPEADPLSDDYIPYASLTPDVAVQWIEASLTEDEKAELQASVQSAIDMFNAPAVVAEPAPALPW